MKVLKLNVRSIVLPLIAIWLLTPQFAFAANIPAVIKTEHGGHLVVDGKPYLILGGEVGNSSAGTATQADTILPSLAKLHLNTVLIPVAWDQIEPSEGKFDFRILDHWIDVARQQNLHLVLLWFGSWKNSCSSYAPIWVKDDPRRFPRSVSADGTELEILSPLGNETLNADKRAFSTLMAHVREKDAGQQTVLMVQVENEVGYLGRGRDRSPAANQLFRQEVPAALLNSLRANQSSLSPELAPQFHPDGKTWSEAFGEAADEVFMAWNYASYIQAVAAEGKRAYPLPMYVNAQLPAPFERAGEYPSGGPHPYYLAVYRAAAPALDFFSPDIYWPNFEYWVQRYRIPGNPIFVPEARLESAPFNALYAYGEGKAFGFAPFGIDGVGAKSGHGANEPLISDTYKALENLSDVLIQAELSGKTRGLVLHADSFRPSQTVALGGYLFDATLLRSWPAKTRVVDDGAMLIAQVSENEFFITGLGLTVSFTRDSDCDDRIAGIGAIEEVTRVNDQWVTQHRLNGDQIGQGRALSMMPNQIQTYRVTLYSNERAQSAH
jgi:hypothetical protein